MRLYFLRHATADDRRLGLRDAERRLTESGRSEARAVGRGLAALGLRVEAVVTSPLPRARETAEEVAGILGLADHLTVEPALAGGCTLGELAQFLARSGAQRVLVVGHEPDCSDLVSLLIGGGAVRMKKAAVACVEAVAVRPGAGELRWLLNADHLAMMGPAP